MFLDHSSGSDYRSQAEGDSKFPPSLVAGKRIPPPPPPSGIFVLTPKRSWQKARPEPRRAPNLTVGIFGGEPRDVCQIISCPLADNLAQICGENWGQSFTVHWASACHAPTANVNEALKSSRGRTSCVIYSAVLSIEGRPTKVLQRSPSSSL